MTKHDELIKDLIERAAMADLEGTATACADARYFRQSVAAINELRAENEALRSGAAVSAALDDARLNAVADERSGGPFIQVPLDDVPDAAKGGDE